MESKERSVVELVIECLNETTSRVNKSIDELDTSKNQATDNAMLIAAINDSVKKLTDLVKK